MGIPGFYPAAADPASVGCTMPPSGRPFSQAVREAPPDAAWVSSPFGEETQFMPAVRLVPIGDDEFPYAEAKSRLEQDVTLTPKDFGPMIAAGRRMGWTAEMIRANEELARRGNCFDFVMGGEPSIRGSLYEDNVFFSITGDDNAALSYIQRLAEELGVRVHRH